MKKIQKKKILVTGGLGYIGSHTIVELIKNGYDPIIIDNLNNSYIQTIDKIKHITGEQVLLYMDDIKDTKLLDFFFRANKIDSVIHFAAYKSVSESNLSPLEYYDNNVNGTISLLKSMKSNNVKNIIFSSSCTVYGSPDSYPVDEMCEIKKAESVYGKTKQMCEDILISQKDINYVILRYFNPIGAYPTSELYENPKLNLNNIVPAIIKSIKTGEKFKIYGNDYNTKDGTAIRDYININDLAIAHVKSLDIKENKIFNIGSGSGYTVLEIVNCFKKYGIDINYEICERRDGDVEAIYADITKAKNELNWEPLYTLDDSIKSIIKLI